MHVSLSVIPWLRISALFTLAAQKSVMTEALALGSGFCCIHTGRPGACSQGEI